MGDEDILCANILPCFEDLIFIVLAFGTPVICKIKQKPFFHLLHPQFHAICYAVSSGDPELHCCI